MPSKRRKRKRRTLRPEAALWGLVIINVAVGLFVSPLTTVRKVRVEGAEPADHEALTRTLQAWRSVPVLRLNTTEVESRLMSSPAVKSATFSPNVFGRAHVKFVGRTAVARIGDSETCLDRDGTIFRCQGSSAELITVDPPPRALLPHAGLCGPWEPAKVALLCELVEAQVPNVKGGVEVGERGVLSFQVERGAEVVLGSSESLPQKIEKLRDLLKEKPELLKSVRKLNLTYPSSPVVVRG